MSKTDAMMAFFRSGLGAKQKAELTETNHELTVSRYFQEYVEHGKPGYVYFVRYFVRHPHKSISALIALRRLPRLDLSGSPASADGVAIRAWMSSRSTLARIGGWATAVLSLPDEPGQYSLGASKQTLRRKVRIAQRLGVHWAEVNDAEDRQELLKLAEEYERTHPNAEYRNPDADNSDMLSYEFWLAAYSADDRPLLLSVTPVDGEFAFIRYFRTIGSGDEQSNARYLMTQVLVEYLVRRKVRYLVDGGFSPVLPDGLRQFQRMLGFRIARIRIGRPGRTRNFAGQGNPASGRQRRLRGHRAGSQVG
jgi:hypothetical protein